MTSFKYDLSDIDPIICKEIYNIKEGSKTHIHAVLNINQPNIDSYDLITTLYQRGLEFDLYIPSHYHMDFEGLRLSVNREFIESNKQIYEIFEPYIDGSENVFKDDNTNHTNGISSPKSSCFLRFPWLQNNKFPLSVWVYTLRLLLKSKNSPVWLAPAQISERIIISKKSIQERKEFIFSLNHGVGRVKGRRPYMEDRDFSFSSVNISGDQQFAMHAVLDGHGGTECSQFAADELPSIITETLRNKSTSYNYADALYHSFSLVDKSFLKSGQSSSGSTATVLLLDKQTNTAFVANTGDTRAVLSRGGLAIDLSKDRKANDPEEIARIYKEGGYVTMGRVMGVLAVARALGDRLLKDSNERRFLICDPEVSVLDLFPVIDEFIILATDGLWDVMSSETAVANVRDMLVQLQLLETSPTNNFSESVKDKRADSQYVTDSLRRISDQLAQHAVKVLSSLDNVTVMIVLLSVDDKKRPITVDNALSIAIESSSITRNVIMPSNAISKVTSPTSEASNKIISSVILAPVKQNQPKTTVKDNVDDIMAFLLDDNNF